MENRQSTRLVPLRLCHQSFVDKIGTGCNMKFRIHCHNRNIRFQYLIDRISRIDHISTALDDQIGIFDQIFDRIGQKLILGKVATLLDIGSCQNTRQHIIFMTCQQIYQSFGNKSRSNDSNTIHLFPFSLFIFSPAITEHYYCFLIIFAIPSTSSIVELASPMICVTLICASVVVFTT